MEKKSEYILLVTVTKPETQAIINAFEEATASKRQTKRIDELTYHHLGRIGSSEVILIQSERGNNVRGGVIAAVSKAIKQYSPSAVIMAGLAFGLHPDRQSIGDIVVSQGVQEVESSKLSESLSQRQRIYPASQALLDLARGIDLEWHVSKVHFGSMFAVDKVALDNQFVNQLTILDPKAIGGDIEGAELCGACIDLQTNWILVKSISDFVDGMKNDNSRNLAARNSAQFVLLMIQRLNNIQIRTSTASSATESTKEQNANNPDVVIQPEPIAGTLDAALGSVTVSATGTTVKLFTIQDSALEKHAATDQPIHDIKQDKLGFNTYVTALHDFIVSQYTSTPLAISVDGPWGTGKSSLMHMLKNTLEPQQTTWQKVIQWFVVTREWWAWFLNILWAFPVRTMGYLFLKVAFEPGYEPLSFTLRKIFNHPQIASFATDTATGLFINPEALNQPDIEITETARWWAKVSARCQPMEAKTHSTVWLNAWKFDNQEEVWAALALSTLEQIKNKHLFIWKVWFRIRLTFQRLSFLPALGIVLLQFVLPLLLGGIAAFYDVIISSSKVPLDAFRNIPNGLGNALLWIGAILAGTLTVLSVFKDPFQIPVEKYIDSPKYKDKIGFLTYFEKDFARIVRLATDNGLGWKRSKLIIFIDDLDRCEPPKAAEIVEAVNLFFDAEGCVFIIGMDSESVAMSIEVKYKDLFERMRIENTGVVSLGRAFLSKIIQIPFTMPRATHHQMQQMVDDTLGRYLPKKVTINLPTSQVSKSSHPYQADQKVSNPSFNSNPSTDANELETKEDTNRLDPASLARGEVRHAICLGTELLSENPRQVKTFINLFRLSIYIANARGFFEEELLENKAHLVGLNELAYWTVLSVRWPDLVKHLHVDAQSFKLKEFLRSSVADINDNTYEWNGGYSMLDDIMAELNQRRENEKDSESHWCHLPWQWWFLDKDFLKCIKSSKNLWAITLDNQIDWLDVFLTMTKTIRS